MEEVIGFIVSNSTIIIAALLGVSEVLAQIPSIKSNSIFELIVTGLKKIAGK